MPELSKNSIMYMPEDSSDLKGVVQIIHDMAEYQGRYRELAQFLMDHGYAVLTSDLKGHGNNIERSGYKYENSIYFPGTGCPICRNGKRLLRKCGSK